MATRFDTYEKYATMHHHEEFETFLNAHRGELTADQIAHLKELGLA